MRVEFLDAERDKETAGMVSMLSSEASLVPATKLWADSLLGDEFDVKATLSETKLKRDKVLRRARRRPRRLQR